MRPPKGYSPRRLSLTTCFATAYSSCSSYTGKEHDFQLFKSSNVKSLELTEIMADKGYQGIKKI
ncbi:MAG: hypothetical protein AAGE84_13275, partial [Cyanobacteria bacterium P01_G01_bin.39]